MIKTGILGASSPVAGEVIRILTHHPDVEILAAYEPSLAGRKVTSLHHGLIGECDLTFCETLPMARLDCVIACTPGDAVDKIARHPELYPNLRFIDLTGQYAGVPAAMLSMGLSEVNRKELVRGAKRAYIPSPVETVADIALYPLANSLLLNDDVKIRVSGNIGDESGASEGIAAFLARVQNSFSSAVNIELAPGGEKDSAGRGIRLVIEFPSSLSVADIAALFDGIYDDHNFSFLVDTPLPLKEVEGTNKCLINISKPDAQTARLDVIADSTLRGGAGDAVHVLNLLFGLHELTGLTLKAVYY